MRSDVRCISLDAPVREAAEGMRDDGIGFLPIIDHDGHVVGAVTDRDLVVRAMAASMSFDAPVREVMQDDVLVVGPDDPLSEAEQLMKDGRRARLIVVDDSGRCRGILTLSTLIRHLDPAETAAVLSAVAGA